MELAKRNEGTEYKKMIFTDGEIYTDGNKIIIYLVQKRDVPGNDQENLSKLQKKYRVKGKDNSKKGWGKPDLCFCEKTKI